MPKMALNQLLSPWVPMHGLPDMIISSLSNQSAKTEQGALFFAYKNTLCDRVEFIAEAIKQGAAVVAVDAGRSDYQRLSQQFPKVCFIEIPHLADCYGEIAARFYGDPTAEMQVIGVTGTNGKSSTAYFIAQALNDLHMPCAFIGTIGVGLPGQLQDTDLTTQDPIVFQQLAAKFKQEGIKALSIEMSSQALAQNRLQGIKVDTVVLTQITSDHLDYHKTIENYRAAKEKSLHLPGVKQAILNTDDATGSVWAKSYVDQLSIYGYGTTQISADLTQKLKAYLSIRHIALADAALVIDYQYNEQCFSVKAPLIGRFNVENISAVVTVLLAAGYTVENIQQSMSRLQGAPGRMQHFGGDDLPTIYVDYAHTADGLEKALAAVKDHSTKQVITIFGCGGDRDKTKRAPMGAIAAKFSDRIVITSDNPRSEDPMQIMLEIEEGALQEGFSSSQLTKVLDREEAIRTTIFNATEDHVILIAGKGHERTQKMNGSTIECDDRQIVAQALKEYQKSKV